MAKQPRLGQVRANDGDDGFYVQAFNGEKWKLIFWTGDKENARRGAIGVQATIDEILAAERAKK